MLPYPCQNQLYWRVWSFDHLVNINDSSVLIKKTSSPEIICYPNRR